MLLPGNASLVEQLDKRVLIVLRDGKHLVGTMRCFGQYSNVVLENTFERHIVGDKYGDIPLGLYVVRLMELAGHRGENIVLLGELNMEKEETQQRLRKVTTEEIIEAERELRSKSGSKATANPLTKLWDMDNA